MPRILRSPQRALALTHLQTLTPPPTLRRTITTSPAAAFNANFLRILRTELAYLADYRPPRPPPELYKSFWIDDRPGEQWLRLMSQRDAGREEVKVDATMFDAAVPVSKRPGDEGDVRRRISLVVEVSRGDSSDAVLAFVCSAWPDYLEVQKVFPLRRRAAAVRPYMGRDFKELDGKLQDAVYEYLEERGVDDELAEFLHEYVANKDKAEHIRWLETVEKYVKK